MGLLDFFWHLSNLLLPAFFVGAASAAVAKLVWRQRLRGVRLGRLVAWAVGTASAGLLAGAWWFGRDGRMESYALLAVGVTATLAWALRRG